MDTTPALTLPNTFGNNHRSEVTSAPMGENTYSYNFDPIGNRTQSTVDSEQSTVDS